MLGQTIAVFFVLLLLAATLWLLRRRGLATVNTVIAKRLSKQKLMQVLERVPLTANHSLHLVRIQDRVILIGVSPSGCQQIDSFAAPVSPITFPEAQ
jgi:flagellar biosynthetic protein FliO